MRPDVKVGHLLTILKDNRDKHRTVYLAAVDGYMAAGQALLDEQKARLLASRTRPKTLTVRLEAPQDHTSDYDRAITMVKMHQAAGHESIILSEEDVAQYVMDDWGWKRAWLANSSTYAAATVQDFYETEA